MNRVNRLKHRLFALSASIVLICIVYFFNNMPFPFGESTTFLTFFESVLQSKHSKSISDDDSRVFINVGYDADLATTRHGKEKITDRQKLTQFLKDLELKNNYREIFLDIRFEEGLKTEFDSLLVEQILNMRNIIIAKHWNPEEGKPDPLIDDRLFEKAAYADYTTTLFNTAFSRYEFLQHKDTSVALKMYSDIDGHCISQIGNGFFSIFIDGKRLCNNASFIRIHEDYSSSEKGTKSGKPKFYNLGEDIYGHFLQGDGIAYSWFFDNCDNKDVIIGDFVFDLHDTYFKKQPGPYLNYLSYQALHHGQHLVDFWLELMIFIIYYLTFYMISCRYTLGQAIFYIRKKSINKRSRWYVIVLRILELLSPLFEYPLILIVFAYLSVIIFGKSISVFVPSALFTLTDYCFKIAHHEN